MQVTKFDASTGLTVPHMGWSGLRPRQPSAALSHVQPGQRVYFVHSFRVLETPDNAQWTLATTGYVSSSEIIHARFHIGFVASRSINTQQVPAIVRC